MPRFISCVALAAVLGSGTFSYADELPSQFWVGLSQTVIDPNYDALADCKRDCSSPERIKSLQFWNNRITGAAEASEVLELTEHTQSASRFLMQTTFGATAQAINELAQAIASKGETEAFSQWLDSQVAVPASHLQDLVSNTTDHLQASAWWHQSLTAPDQLRQRIAFALNHVLTISLTGGLTKDGTLAEYYDLLAKNGLGNFRTLLDDVTYSIGMGIYLDNIQNRAAIKGKHPNENYARELMQLFTIGTEYLALDGSPLHDKNGHVIPTYNEVDVAELAKALTGLARGGSWFGRLNMKNKFHEKGDKTLFVGTPQETVIRYGADTGNGDVKQALDAIFNHPNVGPFIAKRLIQHFVTSNPEPAYVESVARVFNDNGSGVRGDMKAVMKAVLLDDHARDPVKTSEFGKLKEPVLRLTNLLRAFKVDPVKQTAGQLSAIQKPLYAETVFSFFQPEDAPAGAIQEQGKVAPEFTLATDINLAVLHNAFTKNILELGLTRKEKRKGFYNRLMLDNESKLAVSDPSALLDRYDLLLMGGSMDVAMKQRILDFVNNISIDDGGYERARKALYLVMASAQQAVQK